MGNKIFFKGLNEIRAIAALAVVIHHVELYKFRQGQPTFMYHELLSNFLLTLGKNGVYVFFVLSGFLITYLLQEEQKTTGKISIKKFYIRRFLRIWPLYFLLLVVGFVIIPLLQTNFVDFFKEQTFYNSLIENLNYGSNLALCLLFLSNIASYFFSPVVGFAQSWSVSVEEQFYFIWPWLIRWSKQKIIPLCISIIVIMNLLDILSENSLTLKNNTLLNAILSTFHIDFMAMGALFAVYFRKNTFQQLLKNKFLFLVFCIPLILQLFYKISDLLFSANVAFVILFFITQEVSIRPLNFLGKISYGIYMFHPFVMYVSFAILEHSNITGFLSSNILIYSLVIGITIVISFFSFNYFEKYFLKKKNKFALVKTSTS